MSISPCFLSYIFFSNGDNFCHFLFASIGNENILKGVYSNGKEFASGEANSLPLE